MNDSLNASKMNSKLSQLIASLVVNSFCFCFGTSVAQSAITIAQLKRVHNFTGDDPITITDNGAFWISSIGNPSMLVITVTLSFLTDTFGRLNTIRLMTVPFVIGQILMATSTNLEMLLFGRAISTGVSITFPIVSSVYISEVSSPSIRGTFLNIKQIMICLGLLITYIKGKYFSWRMVAYIINGYAIAFLILSMFIPESSYWLALKHRTKQAKKSALWFGSAEPVLPNRSKQRKNCSAFRKSTFYKPMLIVIGFYIFQEFSGSNVVLVNLITFFNDFGTKHDPYTVSIYVGFAKFLVSLGNAWTMFKFRRRSLAIFSFVGMSLFITLSATFTLLVNNGSTDMDWVPPVMLIIYTAFLTCGIMYLPYVISSELWPGHIRGTAQSFSYGISLVISFMSFELYYQMKKYLASWYIQYFYGVMAMGGFLYVYVFLPETHNKTLTEIEEYFLSHFSYISVQYAKNRQKQKPLLTG